MPARRVPTSILEARGTYKKNPGRAKARENEPVVNDSIGPPPACFLPDANGYRHSSMIEHEALWHELIGDAAPGVLNRSHRWHLESACRLKYKERHSTAKTGDVTNLNRHLTQMGMNPAAQSTVTGNTFAPARAETAIGALAKKAEQQAVS